MRGRPARSDALGSRTDNRASEALGAQANPVLAGGGGNDTLMGGTGADYMDGGVGSDSYNIDNIGDVIVETNYASTAVAAGAAPASLGAMSALESVAPVAAAASTTDIDSVIASYSYTLGENLEWLVLAEAAGAIDGTGNELDNNVWGNSANNVLAGGAGNDYLSGRAGNDTYLFNRGDGQETIYNTDVLGDTVDRTLPQAQDEIRFGPGIVGADVLAWQSGYNLVLKLKGTTDTLTVLNYFAPVTIVGTLVVGDMIGSVRTLQAHAANIFNYTVEANLARGIFTSKRGNSLLRYRLLHTGDGMPTQTRYKSNFFQPCWRTRRASVPARLRARGLGGCGTQPALRQHLVLRAGSVATANGLRRSGTATQHVCWRGLSVEDNRQTNQVHSMRLTAPKRLRQRMDRTCSCSNYPSTRPASQTYWQGAA